MWRNSDNSKTNFLLSVVQRSRMHRLVDLRGDLLITWIDPRFSRCQLLPRHKHMIDLVAPMIYRRGKNRKVGRYINIHARRVRSGQIWRIAGDAQSSFSSYDRFQKRLRSLEGYYFPPYSLFPHRCNIASILLFYWYFHGLLHSLVPPIQLRSCTGWIILVPFAFHW